MNDITKLNECVEIQTAPLNELNERKSNTNKKELLLSLLLDLIAELKVLDEADISEGADNE